MAILNRYHDNLTNPRPPNAGCHGWTMSMTNMAAMAGVNAGQAVQHIRHATGKIDIGG